MCQNQVIFVAIVDNGMEYTDHDTELIGVYNRPGLAVQAALDWARDNYAGQDHYRNAAILVGRGEPNNHLEWEKLPLFTDRHWLWDVINVTP